MNHDEQPETPMTADNSLEAFSRAELLELLDCFAKNMIALDGVWFQSLENTLGMNTAMEHDVKVWTVFAELEGRRIKAFLRLPECPGLEGLQQALPLHFNSMANEVEMQRIDAHTLIFRTITCRVQAARSRKNMPWHPCRSAGLAEYSSYAKAIDSRIACEAISCHPCVTDSSCACAWRFTLNELP